MRFLKLDLLYPDGCECPKCKGVHFHPKSTVLVGLTVEVGNKRHWVARSECLGKRCNGYIDWSFDPDAIPGEDMGERRIVTHKTNPLALTSYLGFPRSKNS